MDGGISKDRASRRIGQSRWMTESELSSNGLMGRSRRRGGTGRVGEFDRAGR